MDVALFRVPDVVFVSGEDIKKIIRKHLIWAYLHNSNTDTDLSLLVVGHGHGGVLLVALVARLHRGGGATGGSCGLATPRASPTGTSANLAWREVIMGTLHQHHVTSMLTLRTLHCWVRL